jgi:hypothetical protein
MNKFEIAHYNCYDRIRIFVTKNDTLLNTVALFVSILGVFNIDLGILENAILQQTVETGMDATEFAERGCVQAHLLGETKMQESLDFPVTYIIRAQDKLALSRATDLKEYMKANMGKLTEIKAADITDMDNVITKFNDVMNLPESDIKTRKSEGTELISQSITKLETDKAMMGKLIHSYFGSLEANWITESRIGKPKGMRHISVQYKFKDADTGVAVIKVKCTLTKGELSEVKYTTKLGWMRAFSLEVGAWTLTAENDIYETVVVTNIAVDDDHIEKKEIMLQKKSVTDGGGGTPAPVSGFGNGFGSMYNSVTLETIAGGLVFLDKVAEPIVTEDDGSWGNDHIPADCKSISGTADGYANYFKNITITPDDDNEFDLPMEPLGDEPTV